MAEADGVPLLEPEAVAEDPWFLAETNRIDYLVLTSRELESAAQELADYRAGQGLRVGDRFRVETPGEVVVSGQSGLSITLPGSRIAEIELTGFFGATPETEGSTARVIEGHLPADTHGLRVMENR